MRSSAFIFFMSVLTVTVHSQRLYTGRVIRSDTRKPVAAASVMLRSSDSTVHSNALGFFQVTADSGAVVEINREGLQPSQLSLPASPNFTVALEPQEQDTSVYVVVEEAATFPGGIAAFYKYVSNNLHIPRSVFRAGVTGRVYVSFTINADGTIPPEEVEVIRSVHPAVDAEVVQVIRRSPRWIPGNQAGKAVRQRMTLPVTIH